MRASLWLSLLLLSACADPCTDVQGRLDGALPGETVEVGVCLVEGSLVVPEGVTLQGAGVGQTTVRTPDGVAGIELASGAGLRGLSVEGDSLPVVTSEGAALLRDVEVRVARGIGMRLVGDGHVLQNVRLIGPVTAENAASVPVGAGTDETATHGLIVSRGEAALTDVDVEGFGGTGVLALDARLTWTGGVVANNLSVGLRVAGGEATLDGVELRDTYEGVQPTLAYAAAFSDAVIVTDALFVHDNEGLGVLHAGGDATHRTLRGADNGDAALWVQQASQLTVSDAALENNRLAGLFVAETRLVTVERTRVSGTQIARRASDTEVREVGDGVQALLASDAELSFDTVTFDGNARAGALLDLAEAGAEDLSFRAVEVDGPTEAFGVVAQRGAAGVVLDDAEIVRRGGPSSNDATFSSVPVLGIIGPMFLPPGE
ncbi:MAG: hypothetical protein AB8I08_07530 [Sandaracinaceae bacterium]